LPPQTLRLQHFFFDFIVGSCEDPHPFRLLRQSPSPAFYVAGKKIVLIYTAPQQIVETT